MGMARACGRLNGTIRAVKRVPQNLGTEVCGVFSRQALPRHDRLREHFRQPHHGSLRFDAEHSAQKRAGLLFVGT